MSTKELLEQNEEFLDDVAKSCMQGYIAFKPPTDSNDCVAIARISYRVAMAMLSVKLNEMEKLAEKERFFHMHRLKNQNKNS